MSQADLLLTQNLVAVDCNIQATKILVGILVSYPGAPIPAPVRLYDPVTQGCYPVILPDPLPEFAVSIALERSPHVAV